MNPAPPGVATDWFAVPGPQAYLTWTDASGQPNWITFDLVNSETWDEGAEVTEHPVETGPNVGDHVRVKLITCELRVYVSNEPLGASPYTGTVSTRTLADDAIVPLSLKTPSWLPKSNLLIIPQWDNQIGLRSLGAQLAGLVTQVSGFAGRGAEVAGVAGILAADLLLPGVETLALVPTNAGLRPPTPSGPAFVHVERYTAPEDFVRAMHDALCALKDAAQLLTVVGSKKVLDSMVIESLNFSREMDTGTGEEVAIGFKQIRIVQTQQVAAPIPNLPAGGGVPPANHGAQTPAPPMESIARKALFDEYVSEHGLR